MDISKLTRLVDRYDEINNSLLELEQSNSAIDRIELIGGGYCICTLNLSDIPVDSDEAQIQTHIQALLNITVSIKKKQLEDIRKEMLEVIGD